jgi:hypothetical protein
VSVWSDSRLIGYVGLKTWKKAGEWKTEEAGALGAKKVEELPSFRQTPPYVSMHMQHVRRRYQAAHLLAWPELRCMRTLWLLGTCSSSLLHDCFNSRRDDGDLSACLPRRILFRLDTEAVVWCTLFVGPIYWLCSAGFCDPCADRASPSFAVDP